MKIIFAGGGTAGHINPALAIANFIMEKDPSADILYVGALGKMEETLVKKAGYKFEGINVTGFSRLKNFTGFKRNMETVRNLVSACSHSKDIIKKFKPDICVGTGGYVSGPVLWEASKLGVPVVIHEQNAFPGKTTKMLAHKAEKVMLAVQEAELYFDKNCKTVLTGNPVRKDILTATREESRQKLGFDDRPAILSFGGSLGAEKINEAVIDLLANTAKDDRFQHIHAYGGQCEWFLDRLKKMGVTPQKHKNLDIREYIDDMPECLASADLVICRAGAISLSEIEVQGKASILIPSPNVAENHQYHNAMALVKNEAAGIIEEKDLTGESLILKVEEILRNKEKLKKYQTNAKEMAITDACERIYYIIKNIVN